MAKNIIEVVTKNVKEAKQVLNELHQLEIKTSKDGKIEVVANINDVPIKKAKQTLSTLISDNRKLREEMKNVDKNTQAYKILNNEYATQSRYIREILKFFKQSNNTILQGLEKEVSAQRKVTNSYNSSINASKRYQKQKKIEADANAKAEEDSIRLQESLRKEQAQRQKSDLTELKALNNERVSLEKKILQSENNNTTAKKMTNKELDYTVARLERIKQLTQGIANKNVGNESIEHELEWGDNRVNYQKAVVPQKANYQELIALTKQYYSYEKQLIDLKADPKGLKNHQLEIQAIEQEISKTRELMNQRLKSNKDGTQLTADQKKYQEELASSLETSNRLYQAQRKDIVNTKNATSEFGDTIKKVFNYVLVYRGFQMLTQGIQQAIDTMKELDKAFTDIQMVTGGTKEETAQLAKDYNGLAKELGATTQEVAEGAGEWFNESRDHLKVLELLETRED